MTELHVFYALVVLAAVFVAEAVYLLFSETRSNRDRVNRRMRLSDPDGDRQAVLIRLRKERGISAGGEVEGPVAALTRLVVQSGTTFGISKLLIVSAVGGAGLALAVFVMRRDLTETGIAWAFGTFVAPVMVLRFMRGRRRKIFGNQLPEAIELIVRSLKAGHPVPVAIGMVGRELADPIGTEFGIVADEVTYGSDLVSAMRKMQSRVGQEDLPLFITAVSIQATSGGNLREILQSLADVIRQRIKMRRKIRAISAEGRISAYFLTAMPLLLMAAIHVMSPDYYGEVWGENLTKVGLAGAGFWLLLGNLMMKRMIAFRF
jgi:tight adherence protein B